MMQIVRTVVWVLLLVALLLFSVANWDPTVTVRIWEGLVVDTKIPAIVVVAFLIGFVPMWLYHRAAKWQLKRRIASLEASARTAATTPVAPRHTVVEDEPAVDGTVDTPVSTTPSEDGLSVADTPLEGENKPGDEDKPHPHPGAPLP